MLNALVTYAAEEGATHNPLIPAWYDIIWSAVCFVVILIVFWKVALPKMKTLLDERSAAIEGNIAKADEAQRKAEAALEEYTAQLAEARKEAGEIRDAAREDGKKIVAEAKETAASEAARLTATAHAQIEAERQTALVSLRSEVGTLALDLAGGVIGETLSDDAKAQAVVDRFLAELEASREGGQVMGSATTQALAATTRALDAASGVDLDVAGELFAAARAVGGSSQLSGALADSAAPVTARRQVVADVFGSSLRPVTVALLTSVVEQRWSSASDLVDGDRGARDPRGRGRIARGRPRGGAVPLLAHDRREPRARARARQPARGRLREGRPRRDAARPRASAATTLIAASLVREPRERRVRQLLARATRVVADQRGRKVATVFAASPLSDAQIERLAATLSARYGRTCPSTPSSTPPSSEACACRSPTTSSTPASRLVWPTCASGWPANTDFPPAAEISGPRPH